MKYNYWDDLSGDDESAATYMLSYGEGPGCETRVVIGSFINDGESVLDVGCGPGWNMDHFAEYGPRVSKYKGVDYSRRFIRAAGQRRLDYDFVDPFQLGDCRELTQSANTWDVVILQDVLEHTNGYEKPVKEALRVAKKRVIVSFWHLTENDDHINDDGNDGWGAWYSRPKWEEFLNSLPYVWYDTKTSEKANRQHDFYVIGKESGEKLRHA